MLQILTLACILNQPTKPDDSLAQSFKNPPASSRPHTWWHWMDGNVTREGISADLEAMKQAGIGGAHIFDVGQGIPAGSVVYNSAEWQDLMVHAIREAKRLKLEMTMHNCAGWSSSGAPWVKDDDAMKKVVFATVDFSGPGNPTLPQLTLVKDYLKDVAVFAFPKTAQSGTASLNELSGLGANPGQIKQLDWPKLDPSALQEIPYEKVRADGTIDVELPKGDWTILRIGATLTGATNVASRDSGRGLEVDKLSAESLDNFLDGGLNPLLDKVGAASALTTVLIDSYETGYNNWTPNLLEEFRARRGYDARPFLPALAGFVVKDEVATLGFLFDYRQTIAELWTQNYSDNFAKRLRERNLELAIEPYGNGNIDPFTYAKSAGLIMGEYWVGDSLINPSVKHASSIAHLYGHSVVGAEALTATPEQAGWRNQPRQWKPFADHAMTLGINRIIYHRFAHQPWVSGVLPGMTMGPWGSHVDRGNTIWPYMPSWNEYLSRCQYILQSGNFVGDVLLYSGEDTPQSYAGEGQDLPQIPQGYDFDFCGADPLLSLKVKDHRLVLPNGATYALLALPNSKLMTAKVARKIHELVQSGATIVGPKPNQTPSLSEVMQGGNTELVRLADSVWGTGSSASGSHAFGEGTAIWGKTVGDVLKSKSIVPDFESDSNNVRAIHRKIEATDAYFVASSLQYPSTVVCKFRTDRQNNRVEFWHPETGMIEDAPVWRLTRTRRNVTTIEVPIRFETTDSVFVMIRPGTQPMQHLTDVRGVALSTQRIVLPVLRILSATYGDAASGKIKDVTAILQKAASKNSLSISASNGDMGGDPAVNIVKTLVVSYTLDGVKKEETIRENGVFSVGELPEIATPPLFEIVGRSLQVWQNGTFEATRPDGKKSKLSVRDLGSPLTVNGPWQLKFPSGTDVPEKVILDKLQSWTDHTDFGIKHFSGTVSYSKLLDIPASLVGQTKRLVLDLGDVRELCRVRLNGKLIATMWKPPFRVDITQSAVIGKNTLEVEVTNLWVNRLIGDEQFPDDMGWDGARLKGWPEWFVNKEPRPELRRKTFTTWRHNSKETPLMPSGLIGPVVLRPIRLIALNR